MKFKNKEEAIEFAKKYLNDRRHQWAKPEGCSICGLPIIDSHTHVANTQTGRIIIENRIAKAWDVAVEYTVLDIIPYLYGEALD